MAKRRHTPEQLIKKLREAEEAIADHDAAIPTLRQYAAAYYVRGIANKFLRKFSAAREDFERGRTLAQEQGLTGLLQLIGQELEDLNSKPFQVVPHRSGYAEGVDSDKLKENLGDMDDDRFVEKNAQ